MRRLPPLAALRAFEAAARLMSFKRAASELAVTPTAISHQIRLLEDVIGLRLFERHARRVTMTPEAQRLYPVLRDGFDAFAQAIAAIAAQHTRTVVTLSATRAFAARWLVPRIASFHANHPDLDLRLHASDEPVDFHDGTIDAAIRYGGGTYTGLKSEAMFRDRFGPVCSPHLTLRKLDDLHKKTLIHFEWRRVERDTPVWRHWLKRAGLAMPDPGAGLTFTDESHAIQAAIAGHGVALLSLALVADELASGALIQPFGPVLEGYRYTLVYPARSVGSPKIAAIAAWIRAELRRKAQVPA
jgi:LysR family transcriptional regulator, glycine cleavage system transcriptional activator